MRNEFRQSLTRHQSVFGIELDDRVIDRLAVYYELVLEHNPLLHLVAPCSPEEFATRHILESLSLLEHLPNGACFADIGPGAGLPSVPCLIARDDLRAVLIEAKQRKAAFLEEATRELDLSTRVQVINRQFIEAGAARFEIVTCRALDKFSERLPALIRWSRKRKMLLFGGKKLADDLHAQRVAFVQKLLPLSEQRFLYIVG